MEWQPHPSLVPLLLGSGLLWVNTLYLLRRHRTGKRAPGQLLAVGLVACFAISVGSFALEQATVARGAKAFWNQMQYIGDAPMLAFILAYVLVYVGYDLSWTHYAALFAVPVVVLAGVFTNGLHHLYWTSVSLGTVQGYVVLDNEAGPLFYLYIVFVYVLLLAALALLVRTSLTRTVHRRHLIALAMGTLVPGVAGIAYVLELGPTPTPNYPGYAYLVTAATFTYSVHRQELFSVVPIARRTIIEGMDDGVLTLDNRGIVVGANTAATAYLDMDASDVGSSAGADVLGEIVAPFDLEAEHHQQATVETGERVFDVRVRPLVRSNSRIGRVVVVRDVTDRHRRQQELEELTTRLELALAETDTGVWEWDLQTGDVFWDETSERLFGYEPGGFPESYEGFSSRVLDEDRDTVEANIDHAIAEDDLYKADFRIRLPDGTRRWIQSRGVVEYEGDEPTRMLGVQTDITERKRTEQRLEDQNRKLELLNRLIRHDIRNEADLLVKRARRIELPDDPPTANGGPDVAAIEHIDSIQETGERIADVTEVAGDLMDVIVQLSDDTEAVALAPVLQREVTNATTIDADATVRLDTDVPDVSVRANELLGSVFRNLLTNAIEHNDGADPEVVVSVRMTDTQVQVTVADDGPGIPKEDRETILEEAVTLGDGGGTGYGLWLVSSLIEQYGGSLTVGEASLGGAAVTVRLPLVTDGLVDEHSAKL